MTRFPAPLRWAAACTAPLLLAPLAARAELVNGGTAAPAGVPPAPALIAYGGTDSAAVQAGGPNSLQPPASPAMVGKLALIRGRLSGARAGRGVVLEVLDVHRWIAVAKAKVGPGGGFALAWRPTRAGRFMLRASSSGAVARTAPVEVFRPVIATWFGPGSYGSRTACGQILTNQLVGVAHRTLPCGTMVDIVYGNQKLSVPVVDRGPFVTGVTLDLTSATADALGVRDTVRIGALVVAGHDAIAP